MNNQPHARTTYVWRPHWPNIGKALAVLAAVLTLTAIFGVYAPALDYVTGIFGFATAYVGMRYVRAMTDLEFRILEEVHTPVEPPPLPKFCECARPKALPRAPYQVYPRCSACAQDICIGDLPPVPAPVNPPIPNSLPQAYEPPDYRAIRERAEAWEAVCQVLTEVAPGWCDRPGTGQECATTAIRSLAALACIRSAEQLHEFSGATNVCLLCGIHRANATQSYCTREAPTS